jgi:parvulin-like peptidyl-prolyl isomerase
MPQTYAHARKLQPGEFTREPVKATDGWLIIKLEQRIPAAQMKKQARDELTSLLKSERAERWLANARKTAKIAYPTPLPGATGTTTTGNAQPLP